MRFDAWERRLNAMIDKHGRLPHDWGKQDCVLFAADCVWAVTAKDPAAGLRRTYDSEAGALRLIAEAGGLEALVEARLAAAGIPSQRIDPRFAQRGDLCLIENGKALGIIHGSGILAKALTGLQQHPIADAAICWAFR